MSNQPLQQEQTAFAALLQGMSADQLAAAKLDQVVNGVCDDRSMGWPGWPAPQVGTAGTGLVSRSITHVP